MTDLAPDRQRLASTLRNLRVDAGMSTTQLARLLGWSQSKVSKTERGDTLASPADVELWARTLKASAVVRDELAELAIQTSVQATEWKRELAPGRRRKQEEIRRLEASATVVRVFSPDVVVSLAQTRSYAEAMFRLGRPIRTDESIDEIIQARLARQAVLDEPGRHFEFLMTETALRRGLVPANEMTTQIKQLIELSRHPNISLELITFGSVERVHQYHGFSIIGDPHADDEAIVLAETVTRALAIRSSDEVAEYVEHFNALRASAIRGDELRKFLREVIKNLRA